MPHQTFLVPIVENELIAMGFSLSCVDMVLNLWHIQNPQSIKKVIELLDKDWLNNHKIIMVGKYFQNKNKTYSLIEIVCPDIRKYLILL